MSACRVGRRRVIPFVCRGFLQLYGQGPAKEISQFFSYAVLFVCVLCAVFPFILDFRLADVPAGVTQEEGHTKLLIHLLSAVLALIFLARRIQPFLSLVDRKVELCVLTNLSFSPYWRYIYFARKNPSSCDSSGIRTHIPTSEGFEVKN